MNLRSLIKEHLLLEKKIASLRSNISIVFDVKTGSHADKRQELRNVSRGDISLTLGKAIDEITLNIVTGNFSNGDEIVVRDRTTNLFIPLILSQETPYSFSLIIKTVIRKEGSGRPQNTIWVD